MSALFVVLAVLIVDQLTKFIVLKNFLFGGSLPVIENIFHISLVFNRGFAFGIFSEKAGLSWIWIYCLAITIIIFILFYRKPFGRGKTLQAEQIFLALILGGAIGNLIDRIRFGHVVDFLDFRVWPVFNIADSAITVGTILLVLQILKAKKCIP